MDEQSQKVLDAILVKEPHELTEHDKAFLRARVGYMGRNARKKFQEVLNEKPQEPSQPDDQTVDPHQHPADVTDDGEDE